MWAALQPAAARLAASTTLPAEEPRERAKPRERYLSLRLFADLDDIIDGCCDAWNRLVAEPGRVASLTDYPYLRSVRTS